MQTSWMNKARTSLAYARQAISAWTGRQWLAAAIASALTLLLVGLSTVLIPNSVFARDIAPTWWSYPAWIALAILTGLIVATYVKPRAATPLSRSGGYTDATELVHLTNPKEQKPGVWGTVGAIAGWFAVGCPVCNKIALLALGYSGAMSYFAPVQPFLAIIALAVSGYALISRLSGQVVCPATSPRSTIPA